MLNPNAFAEFVIESVGANLDDDDPKPRFSLLRRIAKLCQSPLRKGPKGPPNDDGALSAKSIVRLAGNLLEANKHLLEFEVELGDRWTSDAVAKELAAKGCKVRRDPFKPLLLVKCPESHKLRRAA